MKILLSGASGFVGGHLRRELEQHGHQVRTLGRGPDSDFGWSEQGLEAALGAVEGVIHLAGENLFAKRWSARQKEELRRSRIETTRRISELVAKEQRAFLISASAVGFYGPSDADSLSEEAPNGHDFVAQLCADWEAATAPAKQARVRVVNVRIGVVLGLDGGALRRMLTPFKLGLGGPLGNGKQGFPWIHVDDLTALLRFLVEHDGCVGVFNGSAPNPVSSAQFARALGKVLGRPALLSVPGLALRILLGEASTILLTGQRPIPKRALDAGFRFRHAELASALANLFAR